MFTSNFCFQLISGGVHVYVFDSGINVNHPDFGGRASMEASFIDYEDEVDYAGHGKFMIYLLHLVQTLIIYNYIRNPCSWYNWR